MSDELFWTKWSAIGQIVGAIGALAAAIVALYLARRSEKPRVKLSAGVRSVFQAGDEPPFPQIISLTIRNQGLTTAHVSQWGWRTGFWPLHWPAWARRQYAIQNCGTTDLGTDPPFELAPGTRQVTILDHDNFIEGIQEKSGSAFFARNWPVFGLRPTPIFVVAHLESGLSVQARAEPELQKVLFETEQRAKRKVPPA